MTTAAAMVGGCMVKLALPSFYLAKTHVTTPNNQISIRPDRGCAINNNAKSVGDQMTAIEVWLPNTMECLALPLSWQSSTKTMVFCAVYKH
jgi:hypothetical protein